MKYMIQKIKKITSVLVTLIIVILLIVSINENNKISNNFILDIDSSFIHHAKLERILINEIDTNSSEVNFFDIEKKIKLNPHVKDIKVFKDLRGNLNVGLTQYKPIARIVSGKYIDNYIDVDGHLFPTSKDYSKRVILIHLSDNIIYENNSIFNSPFGEDLLKMINFINQNNFFNKIISEIDVDSNKNIVIHPFLSKQKIIFGYPDMLEEKFNKISLFYNQIIPSKGWNTYKTVNVKFKDQIICDKFS